MKESKTNRATTKHEPERERKKRIILVVREGKNIEHGKRKRVKKRVRDRKRTGIEHVYSRDSFLTTTFPPPPPPPSLFRHLPLFRLTSLRLFLPFSQVSSLPYLSVPPSLIASLLFHSHHLPSLLSFQSHRPCPFPLSFLTLQPPLSPSSLTIHPSLPPAVRGSSLAAVKYSRLARGLYRPSSLLYLFGYLFVCLRICCVICYIRR